MQDIDIESIEFYHDTISFKELVEYLLGVPYEEVYKDELMHGARNEEQRYME